MFDVVRKPVRAWDLRRAEMERLESAVNQQTRAYFTLLSTLCSRIASDNPAVGDIRFARLRARRDREFDRLMRLLGDV